ncbi:MAG TPA: 4-hydroxy-tetrahydrodipicolinate reductase [Alphaproteobacteria bacterium]|nr:4-hydroxy-tetrahydrodipicolinate reductase [Alphaproteobacteria bacterium]
MTISIGILGASGRMGRMLVRQVIDDPQCTLAGATVREGSPYIDQNLTDIVGLPASTAVPSAAIVTVSAEKLLGNCDVAIDFTRPEVSVHHAYVAAAMGKPLVIGTTGFTQEQVGMLNDAGNHVPLVVAANMSVGVNLLLALVEQAAGRLDPAYDIEIVEMHHKHKIDAPSGTALALGEAAARGRGVALKAKAVYDRKGAQGPRRKGDIGFAVLRGGDVVGEHNVIFAADGERLELGHKSSDRRIFASGAVYAAKWVVQQGPGCYSMKDVLGF